MRGAAARLDLTRVRRSRFAEKVCKACPVSFEDNETAQTCRHCVMRYGAGLPLIWLLPRALFSISGLLSDNDPPPEEARISLWAKAGLLRQDEAKIDGRSISVTPSTSTLASLKHHFGSIIARPTVESFFGQSHLLSRRFLGSRAHSGADAPLTGYR